MEIRVSALDLHHFRYNRLTMYRSARNTLVEISSFESIEARSTLSLCLIASLLPRLLRVLHSRFSMPNNRRRIEQSPDHTIVRANLFRIVIVIIVQE